MSFEPINTQEEFDQKIKERLEREGKKYEEKYKDYDALKETISAKEKEISDLKENSTAESDKIKEFESTISELQGKVKKYETDSVKTRIAREYGIPTDLAGRLNGEDEAALKKDAEGLARIIKDSAPRTAPLKNNEGEGGDEKKEALKEMLEGLKGD